MKRSFLLMFVGLFAVLTLFPQILPAQYYSAQGTITVAPTAPKLTAVDPYAYPISTDVIPARPFLYSVDKNGITITRFNDNKVVGTWAWPKAPEVIYTVTPNGGFTGLTPPAVWDPVGMTVSYPTEIEMGNRGMSGTTVAKPIPDLTPPPTFVYVVMAHSGYAWQSSGGTLRDTIVPNADPNTDSSMLIQIDVSDPSFSAAADPANPVPPHVAAALLGHGAGQPVYNRATGIVYVGNMPSSTLPTGLTSFASVVRRIPAEVAEVEAEVPGLSIPVIRCGPQHPESGIPLGRPQAWACYDPSGVHPINDNEHVGAYGELKQWDPTKPGLFQEQYVWEFRNLPDWVTPHRDKLSGEFDGILYGTPPATGEWIAEARVHNLGDEYGVFSFWTPIQLTVNPTAEYLPVRVEFAAGVPVAYPLEGTGSCSVTGAPAWVDVVQVPSGCIVMGRAPLDGEHYNFSMPGFAVNGYPGLSLTFSGNVFGEYGFVPLPEGVGLSGLAWHQISKVADPSTETPVLSLEYIGVEPSTGQLYQILPPPGQPQPPNERPPETALALDVVTAEGAPLGTLSPGARFGEVAVEADRDIFVAATTSDPTAGAAIKVSGGTASLISLAGVQPAFLSLDSDLRTAIPGVEPGQVDHGALFAAGTGNVAVIATAAATVTQTLPVTDVGGVSVDFGTRYLYAAAGSQLKVAIFSDGVARPPMRPRVWSAEEFTWNLNQAAAVNVMATGDGIPMLSLTGNMPPGLNFVDNGDGTGTITGAPTVPSGGGTGELDIEGGDYAMVLTATGSSGTYAQAFGITVQSPPTITSPNTATFVLGAANSFTVAGIGWPQPIFYILNESLLPPGVVLIDNENGTSSLIGTPTTSGAYTFTILATTDSPPDAEQLFTLNVVAPGTASDTPVITSGNTFTWDAAGAPYSPDPFTVTSTGFPTPKLSITSGSLPPGVAFVDNGNSTATFGGACRIPFPGWLAECLGFLPAEAVGTWTFTITATNSAGSASQTFTLIVEGDPTILNAAPATLSFATDATFVPSELVRLTTGSLVGEKGTPLPYALVTTATWLSATPVSGMIAADPVTGMTGTDITVSANAAGLTPGTYTGTIIVNSAGTEGPPAIVTVTLTVVAPSAPGVMTVLPNALTFDYRVTDSMKPVPQMLWVMSGGAYLPYTVSKDKAKWVSVPATGTAPGGLRVSVDPKHVGLGTHTGTITLTAVNNATQNIKVTLVKTANDSKVVQVMFDVGGSPEGIAIDRNTHTLFISSSNAAAEAGSEAAAESGSETEVPGPPEPSSVFHVNPANKSVIGEIVVHSEGEYIAVNSTTGRAYHASQGAGEVAVIDGATNTVVSFIPLTVGVDVYQPYQVAIDEAQNFIYVGAKAPPIVDPPSPRPGCKAIHEMPDDEYDCWNPGRVFVIDGNTNQVVGSFLAGDDPEGVVFAAKTGKVYASNEDDGSVTVAKGAVRNKKNGSITPAEVISTIIHGVAVKGWWQPTCDANNYCGERGQAALWPKLSACNGKDDEAEEADKMAVDPDGNVYIIDDRYRVAKISGKTDSVMTVLEIPGYQCELEVPDGSEVLFRNTANNIAYMDHAGGRLYVTSEENTVSLVDPAKMKIDATIKIRGALEFDAITTDSKLKEVYITDEGQAALWILKGSCANGDAKACLE